VHDSSTGVPAVFAGGSQAGRDLALVDWAATPLGPPEDWPQSLTTVVQVVLSSRFSMWMAWGPELTFFCNDAYRRDTLGSKYPWALGRPASEVWAEIWPDIAPRIERVMATGEATWDEALLLFLERSGYREESYHTFSYSPLADDAGDVVGMLCVVSEDTERVIGAGRMTVLRDLGAQTAALRSEPEVLAAAAEVFTAHPTCLPFTLAYLWDADDRAVLAASSGVPAGSSLAAPRLAGNEGPWPLDDVRQGRQAVVDDLCAVVEDVPAASWGDPPTRAMVVPLGQPGQGTFGFLVAGLTPYRPFDAAHRDFVELVAGQLSAGLATARAYAAERERAERLAELDRAKTAFFTNVSHEFRTPLTLLLGPAEDALRDPRTPLPPSQRERVELVHRNAQRLLKLVNTLLDFSRLEDGVLVGSFAPVDLAAVTADLAHAFAPAVERAGLSLSVDTPPLPQPVWVDEEMWAKIVLNLLSNALKFTFTGGITVRLQAEDGGVRLDVVDTGTGVPVEQQPRLFERFHRVAGAVSRSHEGSGIGLALVAELAAQHGGAAQVASAPGSGSTFTVRLPFGDAHVPPEQRRPDGVLTGSTPRAGAVEGYLAEALRWSGAADGGGTVEEQATGRPRVLVVDDNADMRDYVVRLLAAEYDVVAAEDGEKGLVAARQQPPDLVLSDVMMPGLDGFELLAALRAEPATVDVPVVLLSARAGEEATVEGLDAGADDYLVKPFSARELLARVRANLELDRVRRTRARLERSQGLLDEAERLARVGSWEVDLADGSLRGSAEFLRQLQVTDHQLEVEGLEGALRSRVHPDDVERVRAAFASGLDDSPLDLEARIVTPDGRVRTYHAIGVVERDAGGTPVRLRGSTRDTTDQREAERVVVAAAASAEAASREQRIADELQRSLLPERSFDPEHLRVATYYRAGVEGTQVGGDWFDVIELGAGRTALVLGDVMGRGVRAAAVMGQLRSAVRAYARLDLAPADVLEFLDGVVRDLGDDHIVTCVYAVYDPGEGCLVYANAGHLPPLVAVPGEPVRRLTGVAGPPLGTGVPGLAEAELPLLPGARLVLYTDGLVEHRERDIDTGIDQLAALLETAGPVDDDLPGRLVERLLPAGPDDDVAVLVAEVDETATHTRMATVPVTADPAGVSGVRRQVSDLLRTWDLHALVDDVVLLVSELVTNALVHGRPPVELRVRASADALVVEVHDSAAYLPRRMRPSADDEHGRGLQLVSILADRWGTRPTPRGKAVWFLFSVARPT
jgi:signal transduction histidine kinase/DNA-binding response OmpR family regulator